VSDDLKCPECGAAVPDTGMSSATGIGTGGGNISLQPSRQHSICPDCDAKLVRSPDSDVAELQHWRLNEP
jgi:endogenous inhibitor of DNA gyrase (YacG/DUF329 family)